MQIATYVTLSEHGDHLRFLKQYGIDDVVLSYTAHPEYQTRFSQSSVDKSVAYWDFPALLRARKQCEDAGMRLVAIENPLPIWCYDCIILGLSDRDQQIENVATTIRNMGRAGVPVYGYHWMVNQPGVTRNSWRTSFTTPGRAGAQVTSFELELANQGPLFRDREYSHEEMRANYEYFIKAIIPVAEEAGVKLALHPDDPPIEKLGGIPRLFYNQEGFQRAMELAASPMSGLNFCLGNWTAMGVDIQAAIRYFGKRGQIIYGHVQGVQGVGPHFQECFLEEADCDFLAGGGSKLGLHF
ncbi:mannonate dehydratase [Chloroflexi bacterium TSY]|nr:mannonate dehydratase [Chloroflexi bacterium TSY]